MNFRLKRTLLGVAAFSVLLPVASHAQVTKGQWVFDGFGRATRDGQGSTCVSSGGADYAFDSAECTAAAAELKSGREAERNARQAARKERMASDAASAQANSKNPVLQNPGPYVKDGYNKAIIDGQANTCIKDGNFTSAAAIQECERTQAFMEANKRPAAAPFVKWADNTIEPGSALKEGDLGYYVRDGNGQIARDGFGRNCVRDSRWTPAYATEACDPELFAAWRARNQVAAAPEVPQPQQELAPRIQQAPPEIDKSTLGAAPAAAPEPAAVPEAAAPAPAEPAPLADTAPGVAPPPEKKEEAKPIVDNTAPEFPVTKYDGGTALAAAPMDDDSGIPEEEPKAMMAEDEPGEDGSKPEEMADEEETTPEMMLSEEDRMLPEEGKPEEDPSMLAQDEPADESKTEVYADEEETTPEMMLSEEDRTLPADEGPAPAPLADTSPGTAPPPEKKEEPKAIVDNTPPEFPITKYDGGGVAAAPAEPAAAQPEKGPEPSTAATGTTTTGGTRPDPSLPIVINIDKEGLFDFGKSKLKPLSVEKLDLVVELLKDATYENVTVTGYTDRIGSTKGNLKLSKRRAEAAKKYLVQHGIDPSRITAVGKGKADPVTGNTCKQKRKKDLIACLAPDRRIVIQGKGTKPRN